MNRARRTALSAIAVCATALASVALISLSPSAAASTRAAAADAVGQPQRLIVGYRPTAASAASDGAAADSVTGMGRAAGRAMTISRRLATGAVLVDLGTGADAATVARLTAAFRADPEVAYVELDQVMHPLADPNDTEYAKQWDLFESTAGMNVPGAWATSTGSGVTVAVIDTGYVTHSDLAGNIVSGYDFISNASYARDGNGRDSNPADEGDWNVADGECNTTSKKHDSSWHGTHVAGTIAATTNNAKGIAGIAYKAKIQPVRVLGKCGGTTSDIADAITWASGGTVAGVPANSTPAKVINMSLGGSGSCSWTYQLAINAAVSRGTTVVVAAGNNNADAGGYQPASCDKVISVAASDRVGDRAFYSNYGSKIDITAPGGETRKSSDPAGSVTTPENGILSTLNGGTTTPGSQIYKAYMGTSMAAPHIAGLVTLILAKKSLSPAEIESAIKNNARALPGTCSGGCGAGLADASKTLQYVAG